MRLTPALAALVVGAVVLTACSPAQQSSPLPSSGASASLGPAVTQLPIGKSDLSLAAGRYRSPVGFEPAVTLTVPAGWTSVHRGRDGFDLGQPDPNRDAPLVALVILTPPETSAAAALVAVRARTDARVTPVSGTLAGQAAEGLDVADGHGLLIASDAGSIALDAVAGQRGRLLAVDLGGKPVVCVVLVPDGGQWDAVWPRAAVVLETLTSS